MVRALDSSRELAFVLCAQQRPAMAADVMKCADRALVIARDDHAGIADFANKIVAWIGNLSHASGAQPHVKVNGFYLTLEPCGVGVVALRKGRGFRNRDFRASVGISVRHQTTLQNLVIGRSGDLSSRNILEDRQMVAADFLRVSVPPW